MANAASFTILITALDKSAATFRAIDARVNALGAPFARIGKSVAALGEAVGIGKLASATENAGAKFSALGHEIGGLLGPIAALGAAASAAGLFEMAKSAADWGKQLSLASEKTGVGVDALAKLHYAAEVNGLEVRSLDKALGNLNRTMGEVASGKNPKAAAMLRAMHISIRNINGSVKDAGQLFPELATHFAANSSFTEKSTAASTLFRRSWQELLPLLGRGGAALQKTYATFERFYGKITPSVIEAATRGAESFETLKLAANGLKFTIGAALFPAIEKLITPLTAWVAAHRQLIATKVGEWATRLGNALKNIDWVGLGRAVLGFAHAIAAVGRFLGPMGSMIAVTAVVFSPFIAATLGAAGSLVRLGVSLGGVAVRIGIFVAESLPALFLGLATLTETALPALSAAFLSMGVAIEATPIGWILTGIAAIAVGGYLIYRYWKPLKAFFDSTWSSFLMFVPGIGPMIALGKLASYIIDHWQPISAFFQSLWSGVTSAFDWAHDFIVGAVDLIGKPLVKALTSVWNGVAGTFKTIWTAITGVFDAAWTRLKPMIEAVVGGAKWLLEHTGLLSAAQFAGRAGSVVVKHIISAAQGVGQFAEGIEQHGAALERLGNKSPLANLIARGEGTYNSVNLGQRGGYRSSDADLASMTVAQVLKAQADHQFNAAGRYQIIPSTLRDAVKAMHLGGGEKFDAGLQDRIFSQYLTGSRHAEIADYLSGKNNNLMAAVGAAAREWASVADPTTGRSHYAGVGNNRASISVAEIAHALQSARGTATTEPVSPPGGSGGPAGGHGTAHVRVDFNNVPKGTRVSARTSGARPPSLETGTAWAI